MVDHDGESDDPHVPRRWVVHERVAPGWSAPDLGAGRIQGRGVARLQPGARCDFPSAQVQARRVVVLVSGRREGDVLALRFEVGQVLPAGAQDLGAFVKTIGELRMTIPERAGAEVSKPSRIEDPEDEIYASATTIRLRA